MCGIYGILTIDGTPIAEASLAPMAQALRHRGPDDSGIYRSPAHDVALGHCRLSIIDLSPNGRQPMWNEDRTVALVFNGEVYNFEALRSELEGKGHRFISRTDCEVIIHGYEDVGDAVVDRLDGMFAFALWDASAGRLLLVRDRLGKKPLYYALGQGQMVFASELKALIAHPGVSRDLSAEAVRDYLTFGYIPSPRTMFRRIAKLPPGHLLSIGREGRPLLRRYWDIWSPGPPATGDGAAAVERIRALVTTAVEKRLVSDVPVGALLSGGVDSTIVVGLMTTLGSRPVQTFTVGFDAGPSTHKVNEDLERARRTAARFGTEHHEIIIREDTLDLPQMLRRVVWHLDEPNANPTVLATLAVAELARRHGVKVVLSGDGGDELFAGYPRYVHDRYVQLAQRIPGGMRALGERALARAGRDSWGGRARRLLTKATAVDRLDTAARYLSWRRQFDALEQAAVLSPWVLSASRDYDPRAILAPVVEAPQRATVQDRFNYADLKLWVADESNMRMDRMTMAVALEARAPLLDVALVQYAMQTPLSRRTHRGQTKYLLKKAFKDLLPPEVRTAGKKGFYSPVRWWLQHDLISDLQAVLSEGRVRQVGLLSWEGLVALRSGNGWKRPSGKLWSLFILQLWGEAFLR
jgi:asparagine synthase (glutamine-hydrolysing)